MVQFECPRHSKSSAWLRLGEFHFPIFSLPQCGVIRIGLQYENEKVGKFGEQNWLNRLQMVLYVCSPDFSNFFTLSLERPILITPDRGRLKMGKWKSPNLSENQEIGCLGHSNWTICSLLSQFYFPNFTIFSLSCWEANSYYPRERRAGNGKMDFIQPGLGRGF